ncbi:MAG: HutP family protein [Clostridia bacterium]|nr:HutP family protein [Clostridia bacterium]
MTTVTYKFSNINISKGAMLLALTDNREDEEQIKNLIRSQNYKCGVTEIGAPLKEFKEKLMKSVVATALNCNIIGNTDVEIHAVVHAALEAVHGILIASLANPSVIVKTGIVSDDKWIAVAMYGSTALHIKSNHERAGMGIMHLPNSKKE